ncbi:MAG: histidine phosphatase superfamily [Monoraphidium minutum]|nr:MAG: histidine phosphatase superfamily [Monoraphidium minutum]
MKRTTGAKTGLSSSSHKRVARGVASAMGAASSSGSSDKVLHFMRHGTTEMNVHLGKAKPAYGEPGFQDPGFYDTSLTPAGVKGAKAAAARVARLAPKPELLVVSPLSRAVMTALLAFGERPPCPVVVEPLFRERLYLSSDVGRSPGDLARDFPHLSFDHLPDVWWHSDDSDTSGGDGSASDGGGGGGSSRSRSRSGGEPIVAEEPDDVFASRMRAAVEWLEARPERSIAVVSHWGVLFSLTGGTNFENCELRSVALSRLTRH